MLKRDHNQDENQESPTTPISDIKRLRDSIGNSSLQNLRTPLKTSNGTNLTGSASMDFISPRRPGDEEEERRRNRAELVKRQQESREALKSPSAGASPRAEPLSSSLKRSTSSEIAGHHGSSPSYLMSQGLSTSQGLLNPQQPVQGPRSVLTASKSRLSLSTTRLNTIQPPTAEQMTKSFDEWMKMAADNKINSKNSWSFALIDYFSELTFLRDGDSINFQKASCTLDGCVKIYASRVDSVVDETTKLLNGLSDKSNNFKIEENDHDEDNVTDSLISNNVKSSKTKKSSFRTVETIEKNADNLILKNFDLEFAIDPLFKKTSAEFDESGSKGALLKNLECSTVDNLVIFDSSEEIKIDFSLSPDSIEPKEDSELIDISLISSIFGSAIIDLDHKSLCPTFEDYTFNSTLADIKLTLEKLSRITAELPEKEHYPEVVEEDPEEEDEAFGGGVGDDYDSFMPEDFDGENESEINGELAAQDSNNNSKKTVKWAALNDNNTANETGLSYFDSAFKQTWAGPEHWKIRKSQRIHSNNSSASTSTFNTSVVSSTISKTRKNSKVEKVAIDFITSVIDFRQIFSKSTSNNQISLSKASIIERNVNDHLLPDDLHFTSGSLLKLFIKPSWKMVKDKTPSKSTIRSTRSSTKQPVDEGGFVDRNFWISQENNQNGMLQEDDENVSEVVNEDNLGEDDYYDNGPDYDQDQVQNQEITPSFNNETNDLDTIQPHTTSVDFNKNLVAAPKFTSTLQLNYARVAKRVDVAKLKATLWNGFIEEGKRTRDASSKNTDNSNNNTVPEGSCSNSFSSLMKNLSKSYKSEDLSEVSVPYCFICLLHLANEKNLEIRHDGNDLLIKN